MREDYAEKEMARLREKYNGTSRTDAAESSIHQSLIQKNIESGSTLKLMEDSLSAMRVQKASTTQQVEGLIKLQGMIGRYLHDLGIYFLQVEVPQILKEKEENS